LFLALFFPQARVFNNFSALFFGLFRFVFQRRSFVFSNFSALFFKITSFLSHSSQNRQKNDFFSAPTTAAAHGGFSLPFTNKSQAIKRRTDSKGRPTTGTI